MTEQKEEVVENPELIEVNIDPELYPCQNKIRILENGLIQSGNNTTSNEQSTLLILNQKIDIGKLFIKLWNHSNLRICADGAANRLYGYFDGNDEERKKYIPDYIIGDLDSLTEEVSQYYRMLGVVIIKQTTQYSTDFTKCVNLISLHFNSAHFRDYIKQHSNESNYGIELERGIHDFYDEMSSNICDTKKLPAINLMVVNGIGGRFDQTIHSITQLYNLKQHDPYFQVSFITDTDIIILIPSGGTLLQYDSKFRKRCIGNCGILPIGSPSILLETMGLKWDVKNWDTSIASGKVSSNNRFVGRDQCYFNVKDDVVLNIEIFLDKLIEYI